MRATAAQVLLLCCGLLLGRLAGAQEGAEPDLDFLEYLGSWQVDDEEWLLVIEWEPDTDTDKDTDEGSPEQPPEDEEEP